MKIAIILGIICLLLISCGKDGNEGRAFVSFDWSSTVVYYDDSNPSIPSTIWRNQNYQSDAGTFYFEYGVDNGSEYRLWTGSYSITKNPGEKGSLFVDGKDGANKYYKIYLGFNGPRVSVGKPSFNNNGGNVEDSLINKKTMKYIPGLSDCEIQVISDGNINITLRFKRKN
ncbi:MAG: hypothetical protein HRF52_13490 [Ignavibacterium sp.]|jgi:hypothetical protein|uniref:hypothetical protein n=1 Tax=Ignavibacterium sp. TaxID=2651167 RepID=UPI003298F010